MAFFQIMLVCGYLYAHGLTSFFSLKQQMKFHLILMAISLVMLPVVPSSSWKLTESQNPVINILFLLFQTIGLPYLLLASTSPLIQRWYAWNSSGSPPYKLFAIANAASLVALLAYPTVFESFFMISTQEKIWSLIYLFLFLSFVFLARTLFKSQLENPEDAGDDGITHQPRMFEKMMWVSLPACGSFLLVSISSVVNDRLSMPLLWVLPLVIYLFSFCLAFGKSNWYRRKIFFPFFAFAYVTISHFIGIAANVGSIQMRISLFCISLFICCMVCHGELERLKPNPRNLTLYYLLISCGGAAGGFFAAIIAPNVFSLVYELHLGLALTSITAAAVVFSTRKSVAFRAGLVCAVLLLLGYGVMEQMLSSRTIQRQERNFYGTLLIDEVAGEDGLVVRRMMLGGVNQGQQYLEQSMRNFPSTYYGPDSGVALAIQNSRGPLRKVGVVGLGAGTIASYGRQGDHYRFYEINPLVLKMAREEFSFLSDSPAEVEVILGDARLSLEREPPQKFDVLVIDAFSGNSIPVHLITKEALDLYFRNLKRGGTLAVHITNGYLDFEPVIEKELASLGKNGIAVQSANSRGNQLPSLWVLASDSLLRLFPPTEETIIRNLRTQQNIRGWTDEYTNLISILKN
jgi:hypothetical protein